MAKGAGRGRVTKATDEPKAENDGPIDASAGVVLLYGPDAMRMREYYQTLREAVTAAHGEVDPVVFDGETAELAAVLDELRTMSLLSSFRLVVVDEAAEFAKRYRPALERYAQQPVEGSMLVLRSATWHKGKLDKLIQAVGAVRECRPYSPAEATAWVAKRAREGHGLTIARPVAQLLVQRLGADLMRLDAELGKLAAAIEEGETVGVELVEAMTGKGSEEKAYAIQKAVLDAIAASSPGPGGQSAIGALVTQIRELVELARESDVAITYFVGDLMRRLYLAAHLSRQGAAPAQIARRLKLWRLEQPFFEAQQRLSGPATGRLFDAIIDLDRRSKSGLGDPLPNLERFCTMLADELRMSANVG